MTVSVISDAWSFTFQLTSSQGGWRIRKGWYHLHILFNSHPHKEDDQTIHRQCPQYYLFNSHPHKEDDATSGSLRLWEVYFQLTSSQGGWLEAIKQRSVDSIFQLTSSQGGWLSSSNVYQYPSIFQLTSSQGGWLFLTNPKALLQFFNSHPHKEDDCSMCINIMFFRFSTHILTRRMTPLLCL